MDDLRREMFFEYLKQGRHIESILLGYSRFMFALQASTVAVAGFFLTQAILGADPRLRGIGATAMLLLGALIGLLGLPVLSAVRDYNRAYVARRYPLELKLADEMGLPDFRKILEKKQAEEYNVTFRLKVILIAIACLCLAGAVTTSAVTMLMWTKPG